MLLYIIGSIGSVIAVMVIKKIPGSLFAEHTLFFVKLGVLADMFLYFIALIGKWIDTEKSIALMELEKELAVEKERSRIRRDLHDELGSSLSGIYMYSHLSAEQIKTHQMIEAKKSLNIIQQSAGEMVNRLNDIVWLINPEQDSLQKLIERLEEYARDMAVIKNMQVKITVPDKIAKLNLPIDNRRNIYLFCKEAINNAVKYSQGSLLELTLRKVDNKLEFSVRDNGKGFDAVMVKRGNGLENMQKRADEIGAKLILQSTLNEGASLSLQCEITQ
jgi:signal transduction histidine kinase